MCLPRRLRLPLALQPLQARLSAGLVLRRQKELVIAAVVARRSRGWRCDLGNQRLPPRVRLLVLFAQAPPAKLLSDAALQHLQLLVQQARAEVGRAIHIHQRNGRQVLPVPAQLKHHLLPQLGHGFEAAELRLLNGMIAYRGWPGH